MLRQNIRPNRFIEPLEGRRLLASTISGTIFNDANVDGVRQSTEKPIANQLVFLDLNFNGAREFNEPATVTDSKGQYAFKNLTAGVFWVRTGVPSGYRQTAPGTLYFSVVSTGFDIQANKDFGFTTTGIVRGTVFNDTNHDGVKQITEFGLSGITVYLDKNNNGKFDSGEKSRKTTSAGTWRFNGLSSAKYTVRVVVPKGLKISTPSTGYYRVNLKPAQSQSNKNWGLYS
jgi:hypothetical protein